MKMVNLRRPPVGVNLQGASYFGGMADVNDHVARVAAAGGGDVDEPELTQFAREVVAMDPAPSLAWAAACGYEAGTLFALDPEDGSGDFAVTRAGTTAFTQTPSGYWKPAAANEPRFTYTNGVRGLLAEGAATRLNAFPFSIENAAWTKSGLTVDTNSGAGYDGVFVDANGINTKQGRKLVEDTSNGNHFNANTSISITTGTIISVSVIAKYAGRHLFLYDNSANAVNASFNLQNGTLIFKAANVISTTIKDENDGYYKVTITYAVQNNLASLRLYTHNGSATSYQGDGVSGVIVSGFFVEAGTVASSPIGGAEGTTQTRNADVVAKTGASALIGQTEGTVIIKCTTRYNLNVLFSLSNGTLSQRIQVSKGTLPNLVILFQNGATGADQQSITIPTVTSLSGYNIIGITYNKITTNYNLSVNGTLYSGVITKFPNTDLNDLIIGGAPTNILQANENFEFILISKTAITTDLLNQLTTL